jgi:NADH-quinone oxidoreductase subunit F
VYGLFTTSPQMGWSAGVDLSADGPAIPSSNPTLVNNVETLANVVTILGHGPEWHRALGTTGSPGVVLCTVSGDTQRAGVAEVELGTPLMEVIDRVGGGPRPGRSIKAVCSGVANGVLPADRLDTPIGYEELDVAGGGLGSAGFVVYDDTADMIAVARAMSRFLYVESCGQCPPCKFGTGAVTAILDRILAGEASVHDVEVMAARLETVTDSNRCYLPVQEQLVVRSILRVFAEELDAHLRGSAAPPREVPIPKLLDIRDGVAVYDERQTRKQPDWTYASG